MRAILHEGEGDGGGHRVLRDLCGDLGGASIHGDVLDGVGGHRSGCGTIHVVVQQQALVGRDVRVELLGGVHGTAINDGLQVVPSSER